MQDARCRMQDARCKIQDAGCKMQDILDPGYYIQHPPSINININNKPIKP